MRKRSGREHKYKKHMYLTAEMEPSVRQMPTSTVPLATALTIAPVPPGSSTKSGGINAREFAVIVET
jgi:hypothetical protein